MRWLVVRDGGVVGIALCDGLLLEIAALWI